MRDNDALAMGASLNLCASGRQKFIELLRLHHVDPVPVGWRRMIEILAAAPQEFLAGAVLGISH